MNSSTETVHVDLGERSYDIVIGPDLVMQAGGLIAGWIRCRRAVVMTDENVDELYAEAVGASLVEAGAEVDLMVVAAGENSKSLECVGQLWQELLEIGADRKTVVVAVGGGVVGDLAGFAAAGFARGLPFVQVPTTLLAQVDSSVGGKTGVNLPNAKNMVGAFWQPQGVVIDVTTLASLPEREYRSGLAEVIKYGVILDADFFAYLEEHAAAINARDPAVLRHVIARSCRLKADVVEADERETSGQRAWLNYGHTFGHALEAITGYGELLHGEAISIGMLCASRLAEKVCGLPAEATRRQHDLIAMLGLPTELPAVDRKRLVELMQHDKKTEHGQLRFILPDRIGRVDLIEGVEAEAAEVALG